jgi:hypothetical protein
VSVSGKWLGGGSFNIVLNAIGNLRCLFVFLRPIKIFTIKIKPNFWSKICHFLKKIEINIYSFIEFIPNFTNALYEIYNELINKLKHE